jgi:hypothetical protein
MPIEIAISKRDRTIINPYTGRKVDGIKKGLVDDGILQSDIDNEAQRELIKKLNEKGS